MIPGIRNIWSGIDPSRTMASNEQIILQAMQAIGAGRLDQADTLCRQVLDDQPHNAPALHVGGLVAYMRRDYDKAIEEITHAVEIEADNPQYHTNLGEALRRAKRPADALERFERAVLLKPEFLKAHLGVANSLRDLGRFDEAISKFRLALAIDPNFSEAYHYLGVTYGEVDKLDDAVPVLKKAVALRPNYSEAQMSLASALEKSGKSDEALKVYRAILEREPRNVAVHNNVGNILKNLGKMDEAVEHYRQALELDPDHAPAYYNLSRAQQSTEEDDETERMETLLADPKLGPERRVNLHFALGKIHDDLGDFTKAFDHFAKGNDLDDRGEPYNADRHGMVVNRLMAVFSRSFLDGHYGLGSESDVPVFILGMPRSGTTLVEQLLASHPQVFGAGELGEMGRIVSELPKALGTAAIYPECMPEVDAVTACKLAEEYVAYLRAQGGDEPIRITDKMPGNFLHLGLIALLLPNAKILHCRREPLDVCLSCYFQHFTAIMPFSRNLTDLGRYFRDYDRLMAHWRDTLPLPMLDVRYEDMVANHEEKSREIIEFCGLEWDDTCLTFYDNERPVKTASSWQVRQPIYSTSVARWHNYESFIGPLKEALGGTDEAYSKASASGEN